jgi:hypothetical protein
VDSSRAAGWEDGGVAITGVHALFYSSESERLRETLRDVFGFRHVDIGGGWMIFALPPAELGVHPGDAPGHELSFMCDDIDTTIAELRDKGIAFRGDVEERRFGRAITMVLPGDVPVLLYEPSHPTAI